MEDPIMVGILLFAFVAWLGIVITLLYTVHTYRSSDRGPRGRARSWLDMEN